MAVNRPRPARTLDPGHIPALAEALSAHFGNVVFDLQPLKVTCSRPVFRAVATGRDPMFVKITSAAEAERNLHFLSGVEACPLLPKPVLDEPFAFDGRAVVCLEWKTARRIEPEDMTDGEADSFLEGIRTLSAALGAASDAKPASGEDMPDAQYETVVGYARRHPLVARLISSLTELPEAERSYGTRSLVPIHGDMHTRNYGFEDGRMSAVFDFDAPEMGLPCEDAAYPFIESIRQHALPEARKRRLRQIFRRLVRNSPWSPGDWRIAVNHVRLKIAANRIRKHPDSFLTAFDIAHRDREVRPLLDELR